MNNEQLLKGKVAIITGASRGIGRACALSMAQAGASVVLVSRSRETLTTLADEIRQGGGHALAVPTDVSNADQVTALFNQAIQEFGQVDIVVNNAGKLQFGKVWDTDPAEWQQLMMVNLVGPYLCTRAALPGMLKRGSGWIVNVSSGAARSNIEGASGYCSSKAALERFTGIVAAEVHDSGVVVTALRPGVVETKMQVDIRDTEEELFPRQANWQQLYDEGNLRPPEEPAQAILWLSSKFAHADGVNGQVLSIDDENFRRRIATDFETEMMPGRAR